jgi:hypothetical protein
MYSLHAFSANCGKEKNQDFARLVLRKSIAASLEGLKFVCHIESNGMLHHHLQIAYFGWIFLHYESEWRESF